MTAHHSILVVNVLDVTSFPEWSDKIEISEDAPDVVKEIFDVLDSTSNKNLIESWHNALHLKDEVQNKFLLGLISRRANNAGALAGVIVGVLVICWMTFPDQLPEALRSPFHAHMITVISTLTIFGVGVACSRTR